MSYEDVEFNAGDVTLRGYLLAAQGNTGPAPCVVMAHGLTASQLPFTDGGHFGLYAGEGFAIASSAARDHFVEHLGKTNPATTVAPARQLSHH